MSNGSWRRAVNGCGRRTINDICDAGHHRVVVALRWGDWYGQRSSESSRTARLTIANQLTQLLGWRHGLYSALLPVIFLQLPAHRYRRPEPTAGVGVVLLSTSLALSWIDIRGYRAGWESSRPYNQSTGHLGNRGKGSQVESILPCAVDSSSNSEGKWLHIGFTRSSLWTDLNGSSYILL